MTEAQGILLNEITNSYWREFSKVIAQHLLLAPPELRDDLMMRLQDHSSCYGSNYDKHLQESVNSELRQAVRAAIAKTYHPSVLTELGLG